MKRVSLTVALAAVLCASGDVWARWKVNGVDPAAAGVLPAELEADAFLFRASDDETAALTITGAGDATCNGVWLKTADMHNAYTIYRKGNAPHLYLLANLDTGSGSICNYPEGTSRYETQDVGGEWDGGESSAPEPYPSGEFGALEQLRVARDTIVLSNGGVLDAGGCRLLTPAGDLSYSWGNGVLMNTESGCKGIDLGSATMYDYEETESIGYTDRTLYDSDGNVVLTWRGGVTVPSTNQVFSSITDEPITLGSSVFVILGPGWALEDLKAFKEADGTAGLWVNLSENFDPDVYLMETNDVARVTFRITNWSAGDVSLVIDDIVTSPTNATGVGRTDAIIVARTNGTYSATYTSRSRGPGDLYFYSSNTARFAIDQIKVERIGAVPLTVDGRVTGNEVQARSGFAVQDYAGATRYGVNASFTNTAGQVLTVTGGIITNISP